MSGARLDQHRACALDIRPKLLNQGVDPVEFTLRTQEVRETYACQLVIQVIVEVQQMCLKQ